MGLAAMMFSQRKALAFAALATTTWSSHAASTGVVKQGRDQKLEAAGASVPPPPLMRRELESSPGELSLLASSPANDAYNDESISSEALETRAQLATEAALHILQHPQDSSHQPDGSGTGLVQDPAVPASQVSADAEKWKLRVAEARRIIEADKKLQEAQAAAEKTVEQQGGFPLGGSASTPPASIVPRFDKRMNPKSGDGEKTSWTDASRQVQEDQAARQKAEKFIGDEKKSFEDAEFEQWKRNVRAQTKKGGQDDAIAAAEAEKKAEKDEAAREKENKIMDAARKTSRQKAQDDEASMAIR